MYDEFGRPAPQSNAPEVTKESVLSYFGQGRKSKQIDAMAEEIVLLNSKLNSAQQAADQYKRYLDHHGGMEVWDRDEILGRQQKQIAEAQAEVAKSENRAHQILEGARSEASSIVRAAREEVANSEQELDVRLKAREHEANVKVQSLRGEMADLKKELPVVRADVALSSSALEDFTHPADSYIDLQGDLRELRQEMKSWITEDVAISSSEDLPSTPVKVRSFLKRVRKLALRAYNGEAQGIIKASTPANVENSLKKLYRSADAIQNLTTEINLSIDSEYQKLKARELELAIKAESKRKLAREAEREHRAELKEQARIDAELEAQRARLQKEKAHYESILLRVEELGNEERALEIRHQLTEIESGIADVEYRQANQRAGYVYVISNIGSFGERMVKIGLTRRLDPMDRVRELGDASVPFGFDVHTLFFSEDAVTVEAELHRKFARERVNRINNRREFFYATPHEVREALADIQGDLLEFVETPAAEQFKASQEIVQHELDELNG
ncbi:DUF4041 domain-containing protein [Kocuria sp. ZOR0020]|uniref:DUF4041 domain-containing protein n=1 Tax=Kocuria sp. ZOR0020 TaxID=1339234 RepID=UPI0018CDBA19|nr:DUF4041 domain-containing protein [Kocuria sp. ZOR0020]